MRQSRRMTIEHAELCKISMRAYSEASESKDGVEFLYKETVDFHTFAIRGTELGQFILDRGWMDVIRDLSIFPERVGNTYGHRGFVSGWEGIRDFVHAIVAKNPSKPVVLTGHSMGGGIAIAGAYDLIRSGVNVAEIVTFGAPRTLCLRSCHLQVRNKLKSKCTEYQNIRDPVPGLMAWSKYHHIDNTFLDGARRASFWKRRLSDHYIAGYLFNLKQVGPVDFRN